MKKSTSLGHIDGACVDEIYSEDDDEDETAELMRELEKIKRERAEQRAKEVCGRSGWCCNNPDGCCRMRRRLLEKQSNESTTLLVAIRY